MNPEEIAVDQIKERINALADNIERLKSVDPIRAQTLIARRRILQLGLEAYEKEQGETDLKELKNQCNHRFVTNANGDRLRCVGCGADIPENQKPPNRLS